MGETHGSPEDRWTSRVSTLYTVGPDVRNSSPCVLGSRYTPCLLSCRIRETDVGDHWVCRRVSHVDVDGPSPYFCPSDSVPWGWVPVAGVGVSLFQVYGSDDYCGNRRPLVSVPPPIITVLTPLNFSSFVSISFDPSSPPIRSGGSGPETKGPISR